MRGKLIVIDGLDKAGKATQAKMLGDYLGKRYVQVWSTSFPDYDSDTGRMIKDYLQGRQQFSQKTINMLYSANRYCHKKHIEYVLNERRGILIVDRYYYSNMAYGSFDGETMEEIEAMDADMPKPDLVIYIDISAEESLRRSGKTADRNEGDLQYLMMVRNGYKMLAINRENWFTVNGEEDKQEIHEQIVAVVEKLLKQE